MAKKRQQATELPLVAIDLGSSGVRAMSAKRVDADMLHILAVEQSTKFPCTERGVVVQSSNAGFMIGEVLRLMANRLQIPDLPTAFVLLGGRSMQIVQVYSKRDQVHKREVSQRLLEEMEAECKNKIETHNPGVAVLGLVPAYFRLDNVEQEDRPEPDQRAELVEAHYIAFVAHKELETQIQKSFDQAGKSIEKAFVRPEALLSAFVASDGVEILRDGCAVLDMGSQTTTLSIYKGTEYLYNKVVPQGGYHITRVLEQYGISLATAEKLKCQFGCASPAQVEKNLKLKVPADPDIVEGGVLHITSDELARTIFIKLEEILKPLFEALNGFGDRIKTLYITGGASMLQGMQDYLQQKTMLQVIYGSHDTLVDALTDEQYLEPRYSALVGALILGADYRDEHANLPVKAPGILEKLQIQTEIMFTSQS
ncbi:MAG: rod shape-determining protein [Paludibacteraceae bacterium]|nr:rod shape-determining protein [Paludibacteraceae bacterium]